jgi:hypothetical protein
LRPNETATECFALVIENKSNELSFAQNNILKIASLGDYHVNWRRKRTHMIVENSSNNKNEIDMDSDNEDEDDEHEESSSYFDTMNVQTKLLLPEVNIEFFPFFVKADLPTFGCLNENLTIIYTIRNRLDSQILETECSIDENEFFSISGKKLVTK